MKKIYIKELKFCLSLWKEKWYCAFWWHTKCEQCACPYLLLKLINWEILHGKKNRLSLEEWNEKINSI